MPTNSDLGGQHIAFYVDEMAPAIEYLRDQGVSVLGEPVAMTEGPSAGEAWCYLLAPWGLQLELVTYPRGMAYEVGRSRILWTRRPPAEPQPYVNRCDTEASCEQTFTPTLQQTTPGAAWCPRR
jgi:catechol 2,3-dioxygenase-like lactoylglutathione lyase family enzyme